MVRDYQEAAKAIAISDYARAIVLLKGICLEDGKNRPVQVKAKQLFNDLEQQAAGRLARARQLQDKGQATEAIEIATDLLRIYPGTQAAVDASKFLNVLAAKPDIRDQQRGKRARDLLAQAKEDYRTQQYLCCLDRCELLAASYADLPEGLEAIQLASEIKNNPEWMQQACDSLSDRLGLLVSVAGGDLDPQGRPGPGHPLPGKGGAVVPEQPASRGGPDSPLVLEGRRRPCRSSSKSSRDGAPLRLLLWRGKPPDALAPTAWRSGSRLRPSRPRRTTGSAVLAVADRPVGDDALLGLVVLQGPDAAGDVVGVEVVAVQLGQPLAAVDGAAGDRLADVVVVFPDRLDQVRARADAARRRTGAATSRRFQP